MIIKGKHNSATVYTNNIEESAVEQIKDLLDMEVFQDSKVRIMPDVHKGVGCVIGFTADLKDKVIPNIVGVDIGCGMLTVKLNDVEIDLKKVDEFIHNEIPSGKNVNMHRQYDYIDEINSLYCLRGIKGTVKKWNRGIGSLGGGNHFIEINVDESGNKYLVIHSGSRNLGNVVANYYQKQAIEYHSGHSDDYLIRKEEIIRTYKEQGRRKEIQKALKELYKETKKELTIKPELCYLEGKLKDDYLHDMKICQIYAEKNREVIALRILEHMFNHTDFELFHTTHNYIDFEDNIVRKGAIKANKDELVLIPINMRDGSILAKGLGNPEWNYSAPHGAGRLFSRSKAKEAISIEDFKQSMEGIYTTCVSESTLDEAPQAYKSADEILENIKGTVEVISILKPIYNFKA